MQQQASVAILSPHDSLAVKTAHAMTEISPTQITLAHSASSTVTTHLVYPAEPQRYNDPDLGAFLGWGAHCTVLVIDSSQGIDGDTINFASIAMGHHPTIIAVTGIDRDRGDFDESLAVCQRLFGSDKHVIATALPVLNDQEEVQGTLNLLTESIQWSNTDGSLVEHDLDAEHYELIENRWEELSAALAVVSLNDSFVADILAGERVSAHILYAEIIDAARRGELVPVMPMSGNVGLTELVDLANELGKPREQPWSPAPIIEEHDVIATVLTNNMVRIWRGSMSNGNYFLDSTVGTVTDIRSVRGHQLNHSQDLEIYLLTTDPVTPPGTTISSTGIRLRYNPDQD